MIRDFSRELRFKTSRSSGAGGQNVNKVETAVTVVWDISKTEFFSEEDLALIFKNLANRINHDTILQLTVSEYRTQLQNKKRATEKILELVNRSIIREKKRLQTKPSKAQIAKRLDEKKKLSERKNSRRYRY